MRKTGRPDPQHRRNVRRRGNHDRFGQSGLTEGFPDEIVDLLQGGQGVFGIAIGKVWSELAGSLSHLQGEDPETGAAIAGEQTNDELAERRKRKGA